MQPVDSIHELFIGVEALVSQPDLHLGEEMVGSRLAPGLDCKGCSKISQLKSLSETFVRAAMWGPHVVVQENNAFSEHPVPFLFFRSTSEAYSAFHNKSLMLLWSLVPLSLSKISLMVPEYVPHSWQEQR